MRRSEFSSSTSWRGIVAATVSGWRNVPGATVIIIVVMMMARFLLFLLLRRCYCAILVNFAWFGSGRTRSILLVLFVFLLFALFLLFLFLLLARW